MRTTTTKYFFRALAGLAVAIGFVLSASSQVPPVPATNQVHVVVNGPGNLIDQAAESKAQIYVDDSFPAVDALHVALRLESQHQSQEAIQKYQDVVDQYGQKLIAIDDDSYQSITDYVRQRLLAMPSVQSGLYDQVFGRPAQKLIDGLIAQHDEAGLVGACYRYFPSTAAIKGLNQAAQWAFERGEFASASHIWQQLLVHPLTPREMQADVLHHIALAEKLAGHDADAKKFRDRLATEFPTATGTVDGQTVALVGSLDALFAQAPKSAWTQSVIPPDEWPMFQGSPSHSLVTDVSSSAGAKLWWVEHSPAPGNNPNAGVIQVNGGVFIQNGRRFYPGNGQMEQDDALSSFPVISAGVIFMHTGDSVLALSASAGTSLWQYPPKVNHPEPNANNAMMYGNYGLRAMNHDACVVFGDRVFAVLPGGAQQRPEYNGRYYGPVMNNRLVALSRTAQSDGKQVLWEKAGSEIAHDLEKDFPKITQGALTLSGSPIATPQGLYVIARKFGGDAFTQLYLVHLDAQTGDTLWGCYLCSASNNNYYGYGMGMGGIALMSVADGAVYISTGQGADCAVDADTGRITWLDITESAKGSHTPENYMARIQEMRAWRLNPPLISGDKLITAETASDIRIYNRYTGKLLRAIDPKQLGDANITCGVIDNALYTVGTKICATNIDTGEAVWPAADFNNSYGKAMGRPFLAAHALYVPLEKGLLIFDIATGKEENFSTWPTGDKDQPGRPGNLLITSDQIIVANDSEIAGYSKWETALASRQKTIAEHPDDPKPYLSLAEIAFRTSHYELAQEEMKKAVDVAVDPHTRADAEFISRLYQTNLNFGEQLLVKSDNALRDRSRFYYECCKATARSADSQAEWRLCLAVLAKAQNAPEEAARLYDDVLTDTDMRNAPFHRGDTQTRAGITAETGMRALIKSAGRDSIYKIYEDRAAAALAKARAAGNADGDALQDVIDSYPNSFAALAAATDLASNFARHSNFADQIKTLRWLYQRAMFTEDKSHDIAARAAADLAVAHASLNRFAAAISWAERGEHEFKDVSITAYGHATTFKQLRDQLRQNIPASAENRRPILPELNSQKLIPLANDAAAQVDKPIADGTLLTPVETSPNFCRPDCFFVTSSPGVISMIDADALGRTPAGEKAPVQWTVDLNEPGLPARPYVLLGCFNNIAVFAASDEAVAVNMADKGKLKWKAPFEMNEEEFSHYADQANRFRALANQQQQMGINTVAVFNGDDPSGYYNNNPMLNLDTEQMRTIEFNSALGRTKFTSLRLLGTRMLAVVGNKLIAYDIASGKKCWPDSVVLPDGLPATVVGNDELIVAQVNNPDRGNPTFVAVDSDTGKWHGSLKLDDERAMWCQLSDDGTLYIVSDQAVSAYDMHGDLTSPIWKNKDLRQLRYPWASALSLDGLLVINNNNELVCLPQEGGDKPLWHIAPELPRSGNQWMALRSDIDGDNVILTCTGGCVAYNTSTGDMAWVASFLPETTPPLIAHTLADPYLIILGSGQLGTTQRRESLFGIDRRGGKLCLTTPLYRNGPDRDGQQFDYEGPIIRTWQVVDNAILLECPNLGGNHAIYAYRAAPKP